MEKQQVMVIHGGEAFTTYEDYLAYLRSAELDLSRANTKGWKDTLQEALGDDFEVLRPRMPNATNAKYVEWEIWFQKYLPYLKEGTMLVGHSLGGLFLAKYIAEQGLPVTAKALFLVAAAYNEVGAPYALADFTLPQSPADISKYTKKIYIMHSTDDTIVRFEDSVQYKKALPGAEVMTFTDRGHFIGETFPELVNEITLLRREG